RDDPSRSFGHTRRWRWARPQREILHRSWSPGKLSEAWQGVPKTLFRRYGIRGRSHNLDAPNRRCQDRDEPRMLLDDGRCAAVFNASKAARCQRGPEASAAWWSLRCPRFTLQVEMKGGPFTRRRS